MKNIHGQNVYGDAIDEETRCVHYNSELDIIAIKLKCCSRWYSCLDCHMAAAEHESEVWPTSEFETKAVLCGNCGYQLTINEYLGCRHVCPICKANFNPGCARHYGLYFEQT